MAKGSLFASWLGSSLFAVYVLFGHVLAKCWYGKVLAIGLRSVGIGFQLNG